MSSFVAATAAVKPRAIAYPYGTKKVVQRVWLDSRISQKRCSVIELHRYSFPSSYADLCSAQHGYHALILPGCHIEPLASCFCPAVTTNRHESMLQLYFLVASRLSTCESLTNSRSACWTL